MSSSLIMFNRWCVFSWFCSVILFSVICFHSNRKLYFGCCLYQFWAVLELSLAGNFDDHPLFRGEAGANLNKVTSSSESIRSSIQSCVIVVGCSIEFSQCEKLCLFRLPTFFVSNNPAAFGVFNCNAKSIDDSRRYPSV